jgi:hypothetical protein
MVSTPTTAELGSSITYRLKLEHASGTGSPAGFIAAFATVDVKSHGKITDSRKVLATVEVNGPSLSITFKTTLLGIGEHRILITYSGSSNFSATSVVEHLKVTKH